MKFKKIFNGSLFTDGDKIFRKIANYGSIEIPSGKDAIFVLDDEVIPMNSRQASEITGIDKRYL